MIDVAAICDGVTDSIPEDCEFTEGLKKVLQDLAVPETPADEAHIYTDGGCDLNVGTGWGIWGRDNLDNEYSGWGACGISGTNNRAEMYAFIHLMELALHFKWKRLTAYIDSMYVLDGVRSWIKSWKKNDWVKSSGDKVENKDLWLRIIGVLRRIHEAGIIIEDLKWVKGHSDDPGNDAADANATRGRLACKEGMFDQVVTIKAKEVDGQTKVKKTKPAPCNRLLSGRCLLFNTNSQTTTKDGLHIYMMNNVSQVLKTNGRMIGTESSENLHMVALTKYPVPQIETVLQFQNRITPDDFIQPVVGIMNHIQRPANWEMLTEYGAIHLRQSRFNVITVEKEPLTLYMRPPRRVYDAMDGLNALLDRLDQYRFNQVGKYDEVMDITDLLYTKTKNKYTLIKEIGTTQKSVSIPIVHRDKKTTLELTVGVDLPPRNNLSSIAKQAKSTLKVTLLKHNIVESGFRYAVVFETETDYAIYSNIHANLKTVF